MTRPESEVLLKKEEARQATETVKRVEDRLDERSKKGPHPLNWNKDAPLLSSGPFNMWPWNTSKDGQWWGPFETMRQKGATQNLVHAWAATALVMLLCMVVVPSVLGVANLIGPEGTSINVGETFGKMMDFFGKAAAVGGVGTTVLLPAAMVTDYSRRKSGHNNDLNNLTKQLAKAKEVEKAAQTTLQTSRAKSSDKLQALEEGRALLDELKTKLESASTGAEKSKLIRAAELVAHGIPDASVKDLVQSTLKDTRFDHEFGRLGKSDQAGMIEKVKRDHLLLKLPVDEVQSGKDGSVGQVMLMDDGAVYVCTRTAAAAGATAEVSSQWQKYTVDLNNGRFTPDRGAAVVEMGHGKDFPGDKANDLGNGVSLKDSASFPAFHTRFAEKRAESTTLDAAKAMLDRGENALVGAAGVDATMRSGVVADIGSKLAAAKVGVSSDATVSSAAATNFNTMMRNIEESKKRGA